MRKNCPNCESTVPNTRTPTRDRPATVPCENCGVMFDGVRHRSMDDL